MVCYSLIVRMPSLRYCNQLCKKKNLINRKQTLKRFYFSNSSSLYGVKAMSLFSFFPQYAFQKNSGITVTSLMLQWGACELLNVILHGCFPSHESRTHVKKKKLYGITGVFQ